MIGALRGLLGGAGTQAVTVACFAEPPNPAAAALIDLMFQDSSGLLVMDCDGRVVRANAALAAMLARGTALASGAPAAAIFDRDTREAVWTALLAALDGRRSGDRLTGRLHADGPESEAPLVEIGIVPIPAGDRAIGGLLLRLTDISAERRLETQLAHGRKLQAAGQLAGGIAHDFNNLLTAVIGAADLVLERDAIDEETRGDVRQIRLSAERGAALVRQLLAFGRQQTLQPRVVTMNDAIRGMAELLRRAFGAIRVELDLETPGRAVRVDPAQLDQVLMNLAMNARDAMPDGGTLMLRSGHHTIYRPRMIGAETIPPGRYVTVQVADTGTGIPPEILPRIFDPYFSTKRERGGSGLGLSTVHGIIRQSGGFLTVRSEPGAGSVFEVFLPRYQSAPLASGMAASDPPPWAAPPRTAPPQAAPSRAAPTPPPRQVAPTRRALLLVDDEPDLRRLAARALGRRGWTVTVAEDGPAALSLLRARLTRPESPQFAALVSDFAMPGMDGAALVRAVRAEMPGLPCILVSGYTGGAARGGLDQDGTAFLPKPYTMKGLADLLDRTVPATAPDTAPATAPTCAEALAEA